MKRTTIRSSRRWSDRQRPHEASPSTPQRPETREDADRRNPTTGLGPYEASYDISLGYGHDRAIVLP